MKMRTGMLVRMTPKIRADTGKILGKTDQVVTTWHIIRAMMETEMTKLHIKVMVGHNEVPVISSILIKIFFQP